MLAFWTDFRDKVPVFWQNFIAGLLIIAVLLSLQKFSFVQEWEDWAVDLMIGLNASLERVTGRRYGRDDLNFTMLDMDELSYRRWNEPFHIPRDKLLKLVKFAVEGRSSVIVVDVDLSKPGNDPAADRALRDYLHNYPSGAPPLILMRPVQREPGAGSDDPASFRETFFEQGFRRGNVYFAQPLFRRDNRDRVIRRWILMQQGCFKGRGLALPSVQLLTYALLNDQKAGGTRHLDGLYHSLNANRPQGCAGGRFQQVDEPVRIGDVTLSQQQRGERLIYTIPWAKLRLEDGGNPSQVPDLKTIPAFFIADRNYRGFQDVAGRVTVIGASYEASHDLHLTPLGLMPGSLVILNAVKSLSLFDQISQPPLLMRLALLLSFVLLISWVFSSFNNFIKVLVITVLVAVFFVPVSFWLFKYGIWFDFGLLLLAIKLQHSAIEYFEMRELKRVKDQLKKQRRWDEVRQEARSGGEAEPRAAGKRTAAPDEQIVEVRLKRLPNGGYIASTIGNVATPSRFRIQPRHLHKVGEDYMLELERDGKSPDRRPDSKN